MNLPENLADLLSTSAALVGAASNSGRPSMTLGWWPVYDAPSNRLSVFVETRRSAELLRCIEENGRVAVTIGEPLSYLSIQFKGTDCTQAPVTPAEEEEVEQHRHRVGSAFALTGDTLSGFRNLWIAGLARLEFTVSAAYDQTPGPNAGVQL